jgi:regulator of sigma E protease
MSAIIVFIVVLVFLITVHELGHFWAARLSGVKVTEFGIGLPPKLFGYRPKESEVEYTLNWLPIGGFVKIFGENYETIQDDPDYERSFIRAKRWKQVFILIAGVLMNFIAAVLLFAAAAWLGVLTPTDNLAERDGFYVVAVSPNSPAENVGLQGGDKISYLASPDDAGTNRLAEDDIDSDSFINYISNNEVVEFGIVRGGDPTVLKVEPEKGIIAADPDRRAIGVYADSLVIERSNFIDGLAYGLDRSISGLAAITIGFTDLIGSIFEGSGGESFASLSGPVGIAQLSSQALDIGFSSLLSFAAFLSLNLVVLNLLPFPALDGGRIVMVLIEGIKGSPLNPKFAGYLNLVGFGLLLLLMLAVTAQDIIRLI